MQLYLNKKLAPLHQEIYSPLSYPYDGGVHTLVARKNLTWAGQQL